MLACVALSAPDAGFAADCIIPADPARWTIGPIARGKNYSVAMPLSPARDKAGLFGFDFPLAPGEVHYVTARVDADLRGRTLRFRFEILGDGAFVARETPEVSARVRLHFQRAGDDWSGRGPYADYRWWSREYVELKPGSHVMEVAVSPASWTSVMGQGTEEGFAGAAGQASEVGFTFGGMFAGHGVSLVQGRARMRVTAFECL